MQGKKIYLSSTVLLLCLVSIVIIISTCIIPYGVTIDKS